ncbi:insulinase family protein [Pseudobacteroides cellulosolvens]|uniref:insulinase family protein n=1 Tax=Pseudobacteroides cellulosolvens TaxID=35825 RepID=UPI00128F70A6
MFEHLREKQGLIYSLSNNLTLSHNFGMMDTVISLRPNKLRKILKSLIEISAKLKNEHYSEEFLQKEKMRFIKKRF